MCSDAGRSVDENGDSSASRDEGQDSLIHKMKVAAQAIADRKLEAQSASMAADPIDVVRFSTLIMAEGRFETGFKTDADTGFVSFLRLMDVRYRKL